MHIVWICMGKKKAAPYPLGFFRKLAKFDKNRSFFQKIAEILTIFPKLPTCRVLI